MDNTDKQTIISTASPRPWRVETNRFGQHYVVCESGSGDQVRDYIAGPIQNESDAALIVEAVNERDRLRDLVRRLIPAVEESFAIAKHEAESIKGICALKNVDCSEVDAVLSQWGNLLREARAAIGEDS